MSEGRPARSILVSMVPEFDRLPGIYEFAGWSRFQSNSRHL